MTTPNLKLVAGVVTVFLLIYVAFSLGHNDGDPKISTSANGIKTIMMRGSVTVFDQRTCADGPMLRISAGSDAPVPVKYSPENAPCRLFVDIDIEEATRYTFEIHSLPPVIQNVDETETTSGILEVDVSMRP